MVHQLERDTGHRNHDMRTPAAFAVTQPNNVPELRRSETVAAEAVQNQKNEVTIDIRDFLYRAPPPSVRPLPLQWFVRLRKSVLPGAATASFSLQKVLPPSPLLGRCWYL
ncbi:LysR family transcriptional regulator [Anopheles sinensis]|uniref:LysR family transcriptional regulator n=1 Tax=Anopheles sinensis TaxID=74873 RepID=A0A084W5Y8_ANOSI|nr:LysR family transcriptional regulator [Anopheles sinensis]